MANFIIGIISLTIGVVVLANVFLSTAHGVVGNVATRCLATSWNGSLCNLNGNATFTLAEYALWGMLGIAAIAGIVYGVLNTFGLA
jgi:hypothetical protein